MERLCDRVIIMKRGRIEDDDSPDQIMARYNRNTLEEVFLDVARGRDRSFTTLRNPQGITASAAPVPVDGVRFLTVEELVRELIPSAVGTEVSTGWGVAPIPWMRRNSTARSSGIAWSRARLE